MNFSPEFVEFVRRSLASVSELEILVLLFKNPNNKWTVESISEVRRSSVHLTQGCLRALSSHGLIKMTDGIYRYEPINEIVHDYVVKLVELSGTHLTAMISLIYDSKIDKIKDFADAFKLRRDK